jgi:HPr kinase/phosphorylase
MKAHTAQGVPVSRLLEFENLALTVFAGQKGLSRQITSPELNRPALELVGYFERFRPERVQIWGSGEVGFIESHAEDPELQQRVRHFFASGIPCCVITNGVLTPPLLARMADEYGVCLFGSPHNTTRFTKRLWEHLEHELSPTVVHRGVLLDVYGVGTLIIGQSGIGKSECALELMEKGHTFVADDLIEVRAPQESRLLGTGRSPVPFHMEIRGIGIIDVNRVFGPRNIRKEKQIDLIVELQDWNPNVEYERVGIDQRFRDILGVKVPYVLIPIRPGRNISTIIEIAAINQKLKAQGVHMAAEFDRNLISAMRGRAQR